MIDEMNWKKSKKFLFIFFNAIVLIFSLFFGPRKCCLMFSTISGSPNFPRNKIWILILVNSLTHIKYNDYYIHRTLTESADQNEKELKNSTSQIR